MRQQSDDRNPLRAGQEEAAQAETDYQPVNWKKIFLTPKYIPWHILGILILVATVVITIHHDEVVTALRPFSEKVRDLPAGWIIPIVILFVISFPPLFGHEIVALLCGVVWGLWIGFGIVAAGTFLGEVGTWFAFKKLFRNRSHKMERTNLNYGSLARLTRDGGFWIVLVIRLSVVPSHFSTAVFSACDVKFWHFCVATLLALPKQLVLVYLGVLFVEQATAESSKDSTVKTVLFGATFVVTIVLGFYIWNKMRTIKKVLLDEQEKRKQNHAIELCRLEAAKADDLDGSRDGDGDGDDESQPDVDMSRTALRTGTGSGGSVGPSGAWSSPSLSAADSPPQPQHPPPQYQYRVQGGGYGPPREHIYPGSPSPGPEHQPAEWL